MPQCCTNAIQWSFLTIKMQIIQLLFVILLSVNGFLVQPFFLHTSILEPHFHLRHIYNRLFTNCIKQDKYIVIITRQIGIIMCQ